MEITATIQSLLGTVFNPVILTVAVVATLALLSGGAARVIEHFDR